MGKDKSYPLKDGTVAAKDARVCACHGASFTVCSNLARQNKKEEKRTSPDSPAGRLEKVREDQRGLGRVIGKNASQELWNAAEPLAKLFRVIPRYPIFICVLHWHVQHLERYLVFLVVALSIHASVHQERCSRIPAIRFLLQVCERGRSDLPTSLFSSSPPPSNLSSLLPPGAILVELVPVEPPR